MPLNKKGKKIKKAMVKQYGKKKGQSVFYAMENSGKLKKVVKKRIGGVGGRAKETAVERPGGRDPSAQFRDSKPLSQQARQALTAQRERARGRISPSTTPAGKAIAAGISAITGIPFLGYKLGQRMVDYSPMAFGVPKGKKRKDTTPTDRDGPQRMIAQQPVAPVPVTPIEQIRRAYKKPIVSSTGEFGYSVGLKKGGMLRQGKPKLAKKGWK